MSHDLAPSTAEVESAILGVLLHADSARAGAAAILDALHPVVEGASVALAVRDRDGATLHVLAERGDAMLLWPRALPPHAALSAEPAIDAATSTLIVPLLAHGHVCGALLFADSAVGAELVHGDALRHLLSPVADVLRVLLALTDAGLRRRAAVTRSIDRVIDGMAHQISNPLTGASAMAQLLADELTSDAQRAAVQQIRHELTRAFTVVSDLLAFHRDTHAHDGLLDLNSVVERVVRFRGYSIRERGIALDLRTTGDYAAVRADARGLEHALLIALRHAELQSQSSMNRAIDVAVVARSARQLAVEIRDSGAGRAPDMAPRYFDLRFNIDDRERETDDEPDLGLVDGILRACGGALEVSTSRTAGTTLCLVLPRAQTQGFILAGGTHS